MCLPEQILSHCSYNDFPSKAFISSIRCFSGDSSRKFTTYTNISMMITYMTEDISQTDKPFALQLTNPTCLQTVGGNDDPQRRSEKTHQLLAEEPVWEDEAC